MSGLSCEACGEAHSTNGDILCLDCAHAYAVLLSLLREHGSLVKEDLDRLKYLLEWRNKREREWLNNIFRTPH